MIYDFKLIGERIKKERKQRGENQEEFGEKFGVSRATVGKWEKGDTIPSFQNMVTMCKMFDCEMGYLLCEPGYENKNRLTTDICEATGLSAKSVEKLIGFMEEDKLFRSNLAPMFHETIHSDEYYCVKFLDRLIQHVEDLSKDIQKIKEIKSDNRVNETYIYLPEIKAIYNKVRYSHFTLEEYDEIRAAVWEGIITNKENDIFNYCLKKFLAEKYSDYYDKEGSVSLDGGNEDFYELFTGKEEKALMWSVENNFMDMVKDFIKEKE